MIRREGPVLIAVEPYKRSPRRVRRARAKSLIANLAVATLGILVLLCAALLSPILWTALSESTHPKAPLCGTIKNPLAPSACPDTLKGGLGDPEHAAPRGAIK
jgi:hypothetical protein